MVPAAPFEFQFKLADRYHRTMAGVELATINRQLDCTRFIGQGIIGPANAGLEHGPEPTADLLCYQVLERRPTDQIQLGLCTGDFSFPFIAIDWYRIAGGLDRLDITLADAANAQHQAFLVKLMFVVIEIDRCFSGVLRALVQALDHWNFVEAPQNSRFDFEFEFQFFLRDHDVCHRPETLRPIVNAFAEGAFRNMTTMW